MDKTQGLQLLAIALGGAVGAVSRFLVSTQVYAWFGRGFPYGTLAVNVIGSLLMGFLAIWLLERSVADPLWRAAILVGFLGAFTTFSTFSMETLILFENGETMRAMGNALLSVVSCIAAAGLGVIVARQL